MTNIFPNLLNKLTTEAKEYAAARIEAINKIADLSGFDHWAYRELLPKGRKMTQFKTVAEAAAYLIKRVEKEAAAKIEKHTIHIMLVSNAEDLTYFNISVEWKRSKIWGMNPAAEGYDYSGRYESGSVSGCGYDKLSTAVANVVNQSLPALKALYKVREQDVNSKLSDVFGYGAGYGILPRLEGGVGVSCYPNIFAKCGYKFRQTGSGKMYDSFEITKITETK